MLTPNIPGLLWLSSCENHFTVQSLRESLPQLCPHLSYPHTQGLLEAVLPCKPCGFQQQFIVFQLGLFGSLGITSSSRWLLLSWNSRGEKKQKKVSTFSIPISRISSPKSLKHDIIGYPQHVHPSVGSCPWRIGKPEESILVHLDAYLGLASVEVLRFVPMCLSQCLTHHSTRTLQDITSNPKRIL